MKRLHHATVKSFRRQLYTFFQEKGRLLPWRNIVDLPDPWKVVVSEIMLQQTQVDRVVVKFNEFFNVFATVHSLADARVETLLSVWKGLGYNRRALNLQRTARILVDEYGGEVPNDAEILLSLPGIGPATSRSICVYAFNKPEVFIETNVRAVYMHHFFKDKEGVRDEDLFPLVNQTLDKDNPAKFYSAVMDYGTFLKKEIPGIGRRSKHYVKQSTFEGSNRQLRSKILQELLQNGPLKPAQVAHILDADMSQVHKNLIDLTHEGFLREESSAYGVVK